MTAWATLIIECICVWALLREQQKLDKTGDFLGNIKPTKGEHIKMCFDYVLSIIFTYLEY